MRRIMWAIFAISVLAGIFLFGVAANAEELTWFNQSQELDLQLIEENTKLPYSTYYNIPCSNINTVREDGRNHELCAQYADFGYVTSGANVMLSGTNRGYPLYGANGYSIRDALAAIPGSNDAILFNSGMSVYKDLPNNIKPKYSTSAARFGKLDNYTMTGEAQKVLYKDGIELKNIKSNGFSFSKTGGKVLVNIGSYQALVDTNAVTAKRFGIQSVPAGYSTSQMTTSLNSSGTVALLANTSPPTFRLYNLEQCTDTAAGMPESCTTRDLKPLVREKLGTAKVIVSSKFISDSKIEFYTQTNLTQGKKIDKYTLSIPGSSNFRMNYLALGDSYASGEGAYDYKPNTDINTNGCHLSSNAYPYLIKNVQVLNNSESIACSGARIKDVYNKVRILYKDDDPQAKNKDGAEHDQDIFTNFLPGYRRQYEHVVKNKPEAITLSIGGNDIDFGKKLQHCILTPYSCYRSEADRASILKEIKAQFGNLEDTYKQLMSSSPGSKVYIVGYPNIAKPGGSCAVNVRLSNEELKLAEDIIADLNGVIKLAAQKTGVFYVDTAEAFDGYKLCEGSSWDLAVNGITAGNDSPFLNTGPIGKETYHPNKLGHILYKRVIQQQTNYLNAPMPEADDSVSVENLSSKLVSLENSLPAAVALPILNDQLSEEIVSPGDDISKTLSVSGMFLKPDSSYEVSVHSEPQVIGSAIAVDMNTFEIDAVLPADLPPGAHSIHITGKDISGELIDMYKNIIVIADEGDKDGDGIPDEEDACLFGNTAAVDTDDDGIDDACDSEIGVRPEAVPSSDEAVQETLDKQEIAGINLIDEPRIQVLAGENIAVTYSPRIVDVSRSGLQIMGGLFASPISNLPGLRTDTYSPQVLGVSKSKANKKIQLGSVWNNVFRVIVAATLGLVLITWVVKRYGDVRA